jgi:hypothetical protein
MPGRSGVYTTRSSQALGAWEGRGQRAGGFLDRVVAPWVARSVAALRKLLKRSSRRQRKPQVTSRRRLVADAELTPELVISPLPPDGRGRMVQETPSDAMVTHDARPQDRASKR